MPDGRIGDPAAADKTLLRFLTCGSVDDGKSTLIGRLLYNANVIMGDQLEALKAESRKFGTTGDDIDFSLLLDGLEDERQQRITIDVAYRYFSTPRRSFIVADSPGHEQYTRNMATGASTADLAVLLVDARKGVLAQTRRHSLICSLLGIRHIVLAVNKLDLVGFDRAVFDRIAVDYAQFAQDLRLRLGGDDPAFGAPWRQHHRALASARPGTRARRCSNTSRASTPPTRPTPRRSAFRCNGSTARTRSSAASPAPSSTGSVAPGDPVVVMGSSRSSRVKEIVTFDGSLARAAAGDSVTLDPGRRDRRVARRHAGAARRADRIRRPVRRAYRLDEGRYAACPAAPIG